MKNYKLLVLIFVLFSIILLSCSSSKPKEEDKPKRDIRKEATDKMERAMKEGEFD
jgi:predicted component of type VI protein secretion system